MNREDFKKLTGLDVTKEQMEVLNFMLKRRGIENVDSFVDDWLEHGTDQFVQELLETATGIAGLMKHLRAERGMMENERDELKRELELHLSKDSEVSDSVIEDRVRERCMSAARVILKNAKDWRSIELYHSAVKLVGQEAVTTLMLEMDLPLTQIDVDCIRGMLGVNKDVDPSRSQTDCSSEI